jgi:hypothetical protein
MPSPSRNQLVFTKSTVCGIVIFGFFVCGRVERAIDAHFSRYSGAQLLERLPFGWELLLDFSDKVECFRMSGAERLVQMKFMCSFNELRGNRIKC